MLPSFILYKSASLVTITNQVNEIGLANAILLFWKNQLKKASFIDINTLQSYHLSMHRVKIQSLIHLFISNILYKP